MAKIIDGRRGGKILVHEGSIYQKNKMTSNLIYWRCASKDCRAPLKTGTFNIAAPPNDINVFDVRPHNHNSSTEVVSQQLVVNEIKDCIREDPSTPLRRIYNRSVVSILRRDDPPTVEEIPVFHRVRSQLKRTKKEILLLFHIALKMS